ncbi:hypothetical protein MWU76_12560 [Gelidibacter sp. F2691]|nr:hypothetical protein [Gelidibacter sp. F2691]
MEENGSPTPIFETDDESYVLVTLPVRINDQASDGARDQVETIVLITLEDIVAFGNGVSDQVSD